MHQRYLAQRDPDGTWSVRELETNCPAVLLNQLMVGMTEMEAVLTVRKLHALDHIEPFAGTAQAPSQAAQRAG